MKILAIKQQTAKSGRPLILVSTAQKDHWITVKQWNSKGLSSNLESYVGGNIDTDYFAEGEELFNGSKATSSDTILRDFNASANPVVLANAVAVEASVRMANALDASALFARKREQALNGSGTANATAAEATELTV